MASQTMLCCDTDLNGIRHQHELLSLQNLFECTELEPVLALYPAILEKPFSPYVCADWEFEMRLEQLLQHFKFLKKTFGKNTQLFYQADPYPLFEFQAAEDELYSVELFSGYENQGSFGIRLMDNTRNEVYSTSLHLSGSGKPSLTVGSLQGLNENTASKQTKIETLTHALHGLSPDAFMVEVIYMLAEAMNIKSIRGITNSSHINQERYLYDTNHGPRLFDFEELWQRFNGQVESSQFYRLPPSPARKDLYKLDSSEQYETRKQQEWLEGVRLCVVERVQDVMPAAAKAA